MTSLAEAISRHRPEHGLPCGVAAVLAVLNKKDRDELASALSDPSIQHTTLARAIKDAYGAEVTQNTMGKHRRGDCRCSRG